MSTVLFRRWSVGLSVAAASGVLWMGLAARGAGTGGLATGERKQKSAAVAERQKEAPKPERPPAASLAAGEWTAFVEPEGQIFPSLLLASATLKEIGDPAPAPTGKEPGEKSAKPKKDDAHAERAEPEPLLLGDPNGLVGIRLRLPADAHLPAQVRVEWKENALMEATVFEAQLTASDREYILQPPVSYKYDALLHVRQPHPLAVSARVVLDGRDLGQRGITAWVHSLNDCLYAYQNPEDEDDFQDLAWMFAAYVNEDHPAVRALLNEARAGGVTEAFDGYQSGEPSRVLLQVFALWDALYRRGIRYSDIGTVSSETDSIWSMHVRFLDESLDDRQANCVDASVLLASVLRKIGLRPCLVLEPGHMFLGFDLDPAGKTRVCVETTLLGSRDADLGHFQLNPTLDKAARRELKKLPSWKNFHAALDSATQDFRKNRKKYERDDDPEYQVIDIEAARRQGILPIAHESAAVATASASPAESGR